MSGRDPRWDALLGSYATGNLTAAERQELFARALEDQTLFDQLMEEQALAEILEEPGVKQRLLLALETPAKPALRERLLALWRRPPKWGMAGAALAVSALLVVIVVRNRPLSETAAQRPVTVSAEASRGRETSEATAGYDAPVSAAAPAVEQRKGLPTAVPRPSKKASLLKETDAAVQTEPRSAALQAPAPPAYLLEFRGADGRFAQAVGLEADRGAVRLNYSAPAGGAVELFLDGRSVVSRKVAGGERLTLPSGLGIEVREGQILLLRWTAEPPDGAVREYRIPIPRSREP